MNFDLFDLKCGQSATIVKITIFHEQKKKNHHCHISRGIRMIGQSPEFMGKALSALYQLK